MHYFLNAFTITVLVLWGIIKLLRFHAKYKTIQTLPAPDFFQHNIYIKAHKRLNELKLRETYNITKLPKDEIDEAQKNRPIYSRDPELFFIADADANRHKPDFETDKQDEKVSVKSDNIQQKENTATDNPFDNPFFTNAFNSTNGTTSKTEISQKTSSGTTSFTIQTNITITNNDDENN